MNKCDICGKETSELDSISVKRKGGSETFTMGCRHCSNAVVHFIEERIKTLKGETENAG